MRSFYERDVEEMEHSIELTLVLLLEIKYHALIIGTKIISCIAQQLSLR